MTLVNLNGKLAPVVRRRTRRAGTMTPVPTTYTGPSRQFLYTSDWWTNILVGANSQAPNLDDPTNIAALRRIAARYDVISIVDPHWHDVGWQVRDRIRQYAAEQGRKIVFLRYMGSMFARWTDQDGDMSILPAAGVCTTTGTIQDATQILTTNTGAGIRGKGSGQAYFLDPTSTKARTAILNNVVAKANGWDGIFLDEVIANYGWLRGDMTQQDPDLPAGSLAYETARRELIKAICTALTKAGKTVGANVDPYTTVAGRVHWPTVTCQDNPGLRYPFVEAMWCADWSRQPMTNSHEEWPVMEGLITWADWCSRNGHQPILNTYSTNPATLRYGAALAIAAGGRQAITCGQAPNPTTDEYADEPPWYPEIHEKARKLWSTNAPLVGDQTRTRDFVGGQTVVDVAAGTGYVALTGEAPPNYTPTAPDGTTVLTQAWPTGSTTGWGTKWATGMALASSSASTVNGAGVLTVGTSSPGVQTQRHVTTQLGDFHALMKVNLSNAGTALTIMYRSADETLNEDNAYGLRVWHDRLELITFDENWTGTTIATAEKGATPGATWYLRLVVSGTNHWAKLWESNDPEPTGWTINHTDATHTAAGWFGFSVAGYGTGGPGSKATISNLTVTKPA